MGVFEDKKKFKRKVEQEHPTNPKDNTDADINKFDIDSDTIKEKQNKK